MLPLSVTIYIKVYAIIKTSTSQKLGLLISWFKEPVSGGLFTRAEAAEREHIGCFLGSLIVSLMSTILTREASVAGGEVWEYREVKLLKVHPPSSFSCL